MLTPPCTGLWTRAAIARGDDGMRTSDLKGAR
jgi:hypothetical protein